MEALKKEFDAQNASCDVKDDINNNAVKTVAHFQSCTEKVINYADADMNSLAFDGSLLVKEIDYADVSNLYRICVCVSNSYICKFIY